MPVFDVGRFRRDGSLERRHRLCRFAEREVAGTEKQLCGNERGLQLDRPLEWPDGFFLVATHRQRHSQVHQEAGVARHCAHQLLVHLRRLIEAALLHGRCSGMAAADEVI
jgi:hypothetical protein